VATGIGGIGVVRVCDDGETMEAKLKGNLQRQVLLERPERGGRGS